MPFFIFETSLCETYLVPRRRVLRGEVEEELLHVPVEQRLQVHLEVERQVAEIILKKVMVTKSF